MALFVANYATAQTSQLIVPAEEGLIIRVQRLVVTAWAGMYVVLLSDPGQPGEQEITSRLRIQNASAGVFDFSGPFGINVERGKALGLSSAFQGIGADYGMMVWYELVK